MVFSLLLTSVLTAETTQQTAAEASENPFEDVKESDWCYDAVQHVRANSFSNGTTDTTFSPHAPCTEAQALTFLWRALGRPDIGTAAAPDAPYYEQAILWALEQSFVDAVGISTTAPAPAPTSSPIFTSVGRHFFIAFLCTLPKYKNAPQSRTLRGLLWGESCIKSCHFRPHCICVSAGGGGEPGCSALIQRQHDTESEHAVVRVKAAQAAVLFGDGLNAAAAVAVTIPAGNGQTFPHGDVAGIGIFDFNEEFVQTDAAVKLYPFARFLQRGGRMQRVFQTVGQYGAKLGVGKG